MTALSDLILGAQRLADRVNASTLDTPTWTEWVNSGAGELYRALTETYEDYNLATYLFTLAGGVSGNSITVGFQTAVPTFDKLRSVSRQIGVVGSGPYYAPCFRLNSRIERNLHAAPPINPLYGNFAAYYSLVGNVLEFLPPDSSAGSYKLEYIPAFQPLVNQTDTIDGTWMATNGIQDFIIMFAARKALIREESLETAALIAQDMAELKSSVLRQFTVRDDNQPGKIADVKRVRANAGFGGWGPFSGGR
jgi:hypothetical protein